MSHNRVRQHACVKTSSRHAPPSRALRGERGRQQISASCERSHVRPQARPGLASVPPQLEEGTAKDLGQARLCREFTATVAIVCNP